MKILKEETKIKERPASHFVHRYIVIESLNIHTSPVWMVRNSITIQSLLNICRYTFSFYIINPSTPLSSSQRRSSFVLRIVQKNPCHTRAIHSPKLGDHWQL